MKIYIIYISIISFALVSCKKTKTENPAVKDIAEVVYASGTLIPFNSYKLYAQADGQISKILHNEGDVIQRGQALFIIDNNTQEAKNMAAKVTYENALTNFQNASPLLTEAINALNTAKIKLKNDSLNFFRLKGLFSQNIGTRVDLDRAEMAYEISANEVASQKQRIVKLRNQLEQDLSNARAQYVIASKDADNCVVSSIMSGKIYDVTKKEGELVRKNDILATIGQEKRAYVQLWIDEADIIRLQNNQEVLIKTDLVKNKIFKAKVVKIYPSLNTDNHSVKVDAEFTGEEPPLLANATIEANILIKTKKNALVIPKKLIKGTDSLKVIQNGKEEYIRIKQGIETTDEVEILSGLNAQTQIVSE